MHRTSQALAFRKAVRDAVRDLSIRERYGFGQRGPMRQFSEPEDVLRILGTLHGTEWLCSECYCLNHANRFVCERCSKRRWSQLGLTQPETISLATQIRGA